MSIFWSLANVSKRQKVTLLLCVLSLTVQWGCHGSAETMEPHSDARTNISGSLAVNISLDKSITPTPEDTNSSAPNNSFDGYFTVRSDPHNTDRNAIELTNTSVAWSDAKEGPGQSEQRGEESKSGHPVVFITLLVVGLAAAGGMLGAYYRSSKKNKSPPSKRLDEESDARDHDSIRLPVSSGDKPDAHDQPKVMDSRQNGEQVKATAEAEEKEDKKGKEEGDTEL